jgi:hypothetical protein
MTDQRKADTRHKIQPGGLTIKAGLGHVDAMALLGLLVLGPTVGVLLTYADGVPRRDGGSSSASPTLIPCSTPDLLRLRFWSRCF